MSLLEGVGLVRTFATGPAFARRHVHAVDGVDLALDAGRTHGLVGESGSGKSTLARILLGLVPAERGVVRFDGVELPAMSGVQRRDYRRRVQPVFQDPYSSLDGRWTVGRSIREALDAFGIGRPAERDLRARDLLDRVGLDPALAAALPSRLSGGQRQRVAIAAALASSPDIVIADEAVSALDVSVQAQVLNLFATLQRDLGIAVLFVSHDLSVVEHVSHDVSVMYLGRIVESGPRADLFANPAHPYTRALLDSVPTVETSRRPVEITGDLPSPIDPPSGCHFHPRCPDAIDRCRSVDPPLVRISSTRSAACPVVAPADGVLTSALPHRRTGD